MDLFFFNILVKNTDKFNFKENIPEKKINKYIQTLGFIINPNDVIAVFHDGALFDPTIIIATKKGVYAKGEAYFLKNTICINESYFVVKYTNKPNTLLKIKKKYRELLTETFSLLKNAYEKDQEKVKELLESAYFNHGYGNYKLSSKYYKQAADLGSPIAAINLGYYYEHGLEFKKDLEKAKEIYLTELEEENYLAYRSLGNFYKNQMNDLKEAIKYYEKGAELNQTECIYHYGVYLRDEKDFNKGMEYIKQAASLENKDACYELGCMYLDDKYQIKDIDQAINYFEKAANLNCFEAYHQLFKIYSELKNDYDNAYKWAKVGDKKVYDASQLDLVNLYIAHNKNLDEAYSLLWKLLFSNNFDKEAEKILIKKSADETFHPSLFEYDQLIELAKDIPELSKEREQLILLNKPDELGPIDDEFDVDIKLVEEIGEQVTQMMKDTSLEGKKKLIDFVIENNYMPSTDFHEELDAMLVEIMDDDFNFFMKAQSELTHLYNQLIASRTEQDFIDAQYFMEEKRYDVAMKFYLDAYKKSKDIAALHIGDFYYYGQGVKRDFNKAIEWYEKANSVQSAVRIAQAYNALGNKEMCQKKLVVNRSNYDCAKKYVEYLAKGKVDYNKEMLYRIKEYKDKLELSEKEKNILQDYIDKYDVVKVLSEEERLLKEADFKTVTNPHKAIEIYEIVIKEYQSFKAMLEIARVYQKELEEFDKSYKYLEMAYQKNAKETECYIDRYQLESQIKRDCNS